MTKMIVTTVLSLAVMTASILFRPSVMCEPPITMPVIN